jgi:hypothetical protein
VGDNQWHLYDVDKDPGEVRDLRTLMPEPFAAMQKEYAAYATAHGVLPIPDWYTPQRAVLINSILNYWLPAYGSRAALVLMLFLGGILLWKMKRTVKK